MRRFTPLVVGALTALTLTLPSLAHATIIGVESNRELTNSTVTADTLAATLTKMQSQGVQVVRGNIGWNEVATPACAGQSLTQLQDNTNPCYNWARVDALVSLAQQRKIQVLVSVTRTPQFVLGNIDPMYTGTSDGEFETFRANYVAFMRAFATRYVANSPHGIVRQYTVWNEPNSYNYWRPQTAGYANPSVPARYAALLGTTAVAIKSANPAAIVAGGPTGPMSKPWKPVPFIRYVEKYLPSYLPGATLTAKRGWVGAWAHNPYPGARTAPSRGVITSPSIGMTNIRTLFTTLDASPITRGIQVWATEFGYETSPPDLLFGIPAALQARYMAESFDWLQSTRRVSILIWYGFTDEPTTNPTNWQSGTYYLNGRAKVSLAWFKRAISVPYDRVRRGTVVRVWARSQVRPGYTTIRYSFNRRRWYQLRAPKQADGSRVATMRLTRTTYFAEFDGVLGPVRVVTVR